MVQSVVDLFQQLARNEFGFFARLKTVSEIMSTNVPVVSSDVSLGDVVGRRDPFSIGSFVVKDSEKGDLIGLLQQSTILRCLPRYLNTLKESDRDRTILTGNVCDYVTRRAPHVCSAAAPLEVLELMMRQHCDCILVYDDPHEILGVVTPVNFACTMLLYYRVFQTMQPLQRLRLVDLDSNLSLDEIFCRGAQTARDVMGSPVVISNREPVAAAIKMMQEETLEFLPLVDEDNHVTGVASRDDILMALQPPSRPSLIQQVNGLPHWIDLLSTDLEPTLAEPISSVAKGRLISVAPTSRLAETLSRLTETGRDVVMVQENGLLLGTVSLTDIVRVFRTLMRLQTIKGN